MYALNRLSHRAQSMKESCNEGLFDEAPSMKEILNVLCIPHATM